MESAEPAEEDRRHLSAVQSNPLKLLFRSTPPALVRIHRGRDNHCYDGALGPTGLRFPPAMLFY